jgi:hypothetical protein
MFLKNSQVWNILNRNLPDRHEVGICTVLKSSLDSSVQPPPVVDVPIKSYNRQFKLSFNKFDSKFFCFSSLLVMIDFMFRFASLSRLHDREKISSNWVSLNDDDIFLCLAKDRLASIYIFLYKNQKF